MKNSKKINLCSWSLGTKSRQSPRRWSCCVDGRWNLWSYGLRNLYGCWHSFGLLFLAKAGKCRVHDANSGLTATLSKHVRNFGDVGSFVVFDAAAEAAFLAVLTDWWYLQRDRSVVQKSLCGIAVLVSLFEPLDVFHAGFRSPNFWLLCSTCRSSIPSGPTSYKIFIEKNRY